MLKEECNKFGIWQLGAQTVVVQLIALRVRCELCADGPHCCRNGHTSGVPPETGDWDPTLNQETWEGSRSVFEVGPLSANENVLDCLTSSAWSRYSTDLKSELKFPIKHLLLLIFHQSERASAPSEDLEKITFVCSKILTNSWCIGHCIPEIIKFDDISNLLMFIY